jgi:5-methylcytosine-specific restriction endonuclease McrA
MCEACDTFDTQVAIDGPRQLQRIVAKVWAAVADGVLRCNEFESSRALIGQKPFSELNLDQSIPDVLCYYFECTSCGSVFGLEAEAFHGQGGRWSKL